MRTFIFIWRDENGNNAFAEIEAGSLPTAYALFCQSGNGEYFAIIEGNNIEMREFIA